MSDPKLTHLNAAGEAHMVDVGSKDVTAREAIAEGRLLCSEATRRLLFDGTGKKGDALATARIAGIMAAKRTSDLIPLCHPLALTHVSVDIRETESGAEVSATVWTTGRTGVEMEALTAVSVALLTLYDMLKSAEKSMEISGVRLLRKTGGKSGDFVA